ncbi:type II secretion system protein N [Thioalkalivibrio sp. ALE11]|uniref:type II secretion system protein N n=1 Tax=Thioalkalivibrio sp. ALE11 TaxID=1265494 RepID=UPI0003704DC8|nr:type II secretion system protein N [Thioalkalivibrio sp. ALE11]
MTEPRRLWPLAIVFLIALAGALAVRAPAASWAAGAERLGLVPAGVRWDSLQGHPWQGQATGVVAPMGELGDIRWDLRPTALLRGRVALDLAWEPPRGGHLRGTGVVGPGTRGIRELEGELPASTLNHLDTDIPLLLDGTLRAHGAALQVDRSGGTVTAGGSLQWMEAAAGVPRPVPLGEHQATLEATDERLQLQLASAPEAALGTSGTLWVDLRQRPPAIEADLQFEARDHADPGLHNFLSQQLEPDPQGHYRWTTQPDT